MSRVYSPQSREGGAEKALPSPSLLFPLCLRSSGACASRPALCHHKEQRSQRNCCAVAQPSGHPHLRVVVWEQHRGGSCWKQHAWVLMAAQLQLAEAEREWDCLWNSIVRGWGSPWGQQALRASTSVFSLSLCLCFSACLCSFLSPTTPYFLPLPFSVWLPFSAWTILWSNHLQQPKLYTLIAQQRKKTLPPKF